MVQVAAVGLWLVGGGCALGIAWRLLHTGRWRNPLAGVAVPSDGPSLASASVAVLAYVALHAVCSLLFVGPSPVADAPTPGTELWHRTTCADSVAKLLATGLMIVLLAQARSGPLRKQAVWKFAGTASAIVCLLAVLPLIDVQLWAGTRLWRWLHPDEVVPIHGVLVALGRSQWGPLGTLQLWLGAVIIAPLAEELFFRGLLLQALCFHWHRAWPAIAASSVLFGLVHGQPQDIVPLVVLGLVLGYLRVRHGSLWPCLLVHVLFNVRTMTFALLAPELVQS
jgi:membrane protease YdiL (CAAX protease family)